MKNRNVMPSLDLLQGFEAAARHLSFTKAGEELFITQSAVSRQIKELEEQLGVELFHAAQPCHLGRWQGARRQGQARALARHAGGARLEGHLHIRLFPVGYWLWTPESTGRRGFGRHVPGGRGIGARRGGKHG